jgi:hypothetical protein
VSLGPDWTPLVRVDATLAPFCEREVFGFVLNGTRLTFKPGTCTGVLEHDIRDAKTELAACVHEVKLAYGRKDQVRATRLRRKQFKLEHWLVEAHRDLIALAEPYEYPHGRHYQAPLELVTQESEEPCSDPPTDA